MEDESFKRVEDLIKEIRVLKKQYKLLKTEYDNTYSKSNEYRIEISELKTQLEELNNLNNSYRTQLKSKERENKRREKNWKVKHKKLENQIDSLLRNPKLKNELLLNVEIKNCNRRIILMEEIIHILGKKSNFDFELFKQVLEIAEGIEDPLFKTLIEDFKNND
ncbi:hypothetical protein TCON_1815 [Astathelohania contejeani]|uniref:Uncharacterized protein n=1 Tax=Astathelohania contejeani TaxID=164912 RepID=A0ABQ7HXS8_9MICR|nr:hypothetical protein TCON_1815 [Thelohania contejeani]